MSQVALITGCSSGIGLALVQQLVTLNYHVIATVRREEDLAQVTALGAEGQLLDVTDAQGVDALVSDVEQRYRGLDVLINNAGFGAMGPVLDFDDNALAHQFEVNVMAPVRLARAALMLLKARGGVVFNIGSVAGEVSSPYAGVYCASKAALHRLNDAMRMELAPLGVDVVLVRPGAIESRFGQRARHELAGRLKEDSLWRPFRAGIDKRAGSSELLSSTPASRLAGKVASALVASRRPAIIRVGNGGLALPLLAVLPHRMRDYWLKRYFGLNDASS